MKNESRSNALIQACTLNVLFSTSLGPSNYWCSRLSLCVAEVPVISDSLHSLCIYFWSGFNSLYSNHDTELHFSLLVTEGKVVAMATGKLKCGPWRVSPRQKWQPSLLSNTVLRCDLSCQMYRAVRNWGITAWKRRTAHQLNCGLLSFETEFFDPWFGAWFTGQ